MLTPTGYPPPTQQPTWPTAHTAHSQHCGHTALPPGQKTDLYVFGERCCSKLLDEPTLAFVTRYCFTSRLLCTNQPSFHSPRPPALPTLVQYYCTTIGQYTTSPPNSRVYAIHQTRLAVTTSCIGQNPLHLPLSCTGWTTSELEAKCYLISINLYRCLYLPVYIYVHVDLYVFVERSRSETSGSPISQVKPT